MRLLLAISLFCVLIGCKPKAPGIKTGTWRGIIEMQGQQLPFTFEISGDSSGYTAHLKNGSESLLLDEISLNGDSIYMVLHIFDAELRARIDGDNLTGYYVRKYEKDYKLPFHAQWGDDFRFTDDMSEPNQEFTGTYAVKFINEKDTSHSVGIFTQNGNKVEGTFLNIDGDYRYLEGNVVDGKMWLSTFDGYHLYIFSASQEENGTLSGDYWSGRSFHQKWIAVKDPNAKLADADSLTFLKEGYDKLEFSFPGLDGKKISSSDERFKDKIVILQLFGTWCPNCMDETKFLARWYRKNKDRNVEIVGLAYERKADFDYAVSRVQKMREKLGVDYDFVIAGTSDKVQASTTLPALNRVLAFPTTIFIGKDGKVKRIHTGFSGPGTGIYYERFIQQFNDTVDELLGENLTSSTK